VGGDASQAGLEEARGEFHNRLRGHIVRPLEQWSEGLAAVEVRTATARFILNYVVNLSLQSDNQFYYIIYFLKIAMAAGSAWSDRPWLWLEEEGSGGMKSVLQIAEGATSCAHRSSGARGWLLWRSAQFVLHNALYNISEFYNRLRGHIVRPLEQWSEGLAAVEVRTCSIFRNDNVY
jgi:hypothetical protein